MDVRLAESLGRALPRRAGGRYVGRVDWKEDELEEEEQQQVALV